MVQMRFFVLFFNCRIC